MPAPNKAEREQCWIAKDSLWECLDKNSDNASKCQEQNDLFQKSCSKTWVKYFVRRRDYIKYKDKLEKEGFEPANQKQ